MFAGIQEILILVIVILSLFLLPRLLSRNQNRKIQQPSVSGMFSALSGRMRLALVASAVWPLLTAGYFRPWKTGFFPYLYIGVFPVFLLWGIHWVIGGFRKKK
ncbi:MAG: hypothetical protein JRK26_24255 [Deltaproteobacteria bacterium]|nr:hypothetical protein [Deltaproteobacteria bacterium]